MQDQAQSPVALVQTEQIIRQVILSWTAQNKAITNFFNKYNDQVYLNEVAPGRNRAVYLLGHLISSNDGLLPLLGLGERLYPQLETMFSVSPDRTFADIPSLSELKQYAETVSQTLTNHFSAMQPHEWLERHTRVSEEDFAADPVRNKLNVLLSRTIHIGYHLGQLTFLTEAE
jgi:hypothetical protein